MSVLFSTDTKRRKTKKIFSVFLIFSLLAVNFLGFNINKIYAATVPDAPSGLTATASDLQVLLEWVAPASDGGSPLTDYVIEYKIHSDSTWTQIGHTPSTSTSIVANDQNAGLVNGSEYDFRVFAVNAIGPSVTASNTVQSTPATTPGAPIIGVATGGNSSASVSFTPLSNPTVAPWYGTSGWTYRKKITINKALVPNTNQIDFPVMISLSGLSNINTNGTDIRFTSSDGRTELPREIESYSGGTLVAWVKVPTLFTSKNTEIYMYYGNASQTSEPASDSTYGKNNVWDNNFKGVWHLPVIGDTLDVSDSTINVNNGANNGVTASSGKLDGAGSFNGTTNNVTVNDSTSLNLTTGISVSSWIKWSIDPSTGKSYATIVNKNGDNQYRLQHNINNSAFEFGIRTSAGNTFVASTTAPVVDTWYHLFGTWDGSSAKIYVNGNLEKSAARLGTLLSSTLPLKIGTNSISTASFRWFTGTIDETKLSSVARSIDWIKTEYNNQSSPATFYEVAGEENISNSATNGGSVVIDYTTTSNPGGIIATSASSPVLVTGLTNGTEYTFTVTARNIMGTGPASTASNPVTPVTVPGEPTAVTATPGDKEVSLLWSTPASDGGSEITDYIIEYKLTSDPDIPANWQIYSEPETPVIVETLVTGLTNGTSYDFRISAINIEGTGNPSSPLVSSTPRTIPGKPIITSVVSGDTQVTVNFTAPDNGGSAITGYLVSSNDGGTDSNSGSTNLSHIVTGLTNGTAYTFTVVATNIVGPGPASDASDSVTPAKAPGIPTGLVATPGASQVGLSWNAPADNGSPITNYIIEYKLNSDTEWTQFGHPESPNTNITVVDLVNGSLYSFRVSAYNSAGMGEASSPLVESTPRTVPEKPVITNVERGDGQVTVSFNYPNNGGSEISNYTVTSNPQGIIQTGSTSPIIVTGLTNGTSYTFTVTATNAAGEGLSSDPSSSVVPATVPSRVTGVVATAGNGEVTITFSEPLSNGGSAITGYIVNSNNGGTDINSGSTSLSHTVTGLTNGNTYTFTVVAINEVGSSLASEASVPITLPTIPTAPLNIATEVKSRSIKLTWSEPLSNGGSAIVDYVIEYQTTINGEWVVFDDDITVDRFVVVTGLSNGTSYDFRVSAKNIIGTSEVSSAVSATPGEPAQVRIMGFSDLTNTSISTDVRITNEGLIEYEYQYDWCVTDAVDNLCGGGNDIFSASNAKLIKPDHNFDFTATSVVSTPGNYYFHIKVLFGSTSSSAFSSFSAVATFPDPPTSVSAVAGNAQATVSFVIPSSNGGSAITNYTVTSTPGGITGTGLSTPIIVTGLTNGTAYTFTMTATNAIGTGLSSSPPSNSVTPVTVPGAVTSFSASAGNTQVGLFWSAPASNGGSAVTDYVIEYKLSSDSSWSIFADAVNTATTAIISGLTNNLSYDFRVSAVNTIGQGSFNSTSATSTAPQPTDTHDGSRVSGYYPNKTKTVLPNLPVIETKTTSEAKTKVPEIPLPSKPSTDTWPAKNEKPSTQITETDNEVTSTPTETSRITPPAEQKQIRVDNSRENKESSIPVAWIIVSSLVIISSGFTIFILRRRHRRG